MVSLFITLVGVCSVVVSASVITMRILLGFTPLSVSRARPSSQGMIAREFAPNAGAKPVAPRLSAACT